MGEFFRGWRRKVGFVPLVMAAAILGFSMRARCVHENFLFGSGYGKEIHSISSESIGVTWARYQDDKECSFDAGWHSYSYSESEWREPFDQFARKHNCEWRWQSCGFDFCKLRNISSDDDHLTFWTIPYWVLILPPTLLSAYLILRPGKRSGRQANAMNDSCSAKQAYLS